MPAQTKVWTSQFRWNESRSTSNVNASWIRMKTWLKAHQIRSSNLSPYLEASWSLRLCWLKQDNLGDLQYNAPPSGCPRVGIFQLEGCQMPHLILFLLEYFTRNCSSAISEKHSEALHMKAMVNYVPNYFNNFNIFASPKHKTAILFQSPRTTNAFSDVHFFCHDTLQTTTSTIPTSWWCTVLWIAEISRV